MTFHMRSATIEQKPIIFDLIQPYLDELSRFPDDEPDYKDAEGVYHYRYLDAYWQEETRFPYLFFDGDRLAGFALVRMDGDHWEMAEIYVLPEFRRRDLAGTCVADIFKRHTGVWKISFNKHNAPSRHFWRKLAASLADGRVEEGELDGNHDYIAFSIPR
jgi:predicted acetyltransferase